MTTLTVHCDRCGERIDAGRTLATIETGPLRTRWPTLDLCAPCSESLAGWIGGARLLDQRAVDAPESVNESEQARTGETA